MVLRTLFYHRLTTIPYVNALLHWSVGKVATIKRIATTPLALGKKNKHRRFISCSVYGQKE